MIQTTFQNGQVLTSSALTTEQIDALFQKVVNRMLGITVDLKLFCETVIQNAVIQSAITPANLENGFEATGANISADSVVVGISAAKNVLSIELSKVAIASGADFVSFSNPIYNTRVRTSWEQKGAPAFAITDDVLFLQCVPNSSSYNVRDESWTEVTGNPEIMLKNRSYTREWRVSFIAYGPNSFDSIRLIKTMLLEDFSHDMLARENLYYVPDTNTPVRNPELFESQWWERVDYVANFNEYVNESITLDKVASIPVIGQNFNVNIQGVEQ